MRTATRTSIEACREFAAAVDFAADLASADLTLWDALADALATWANVTSAQDAPGVDPLRSVLRELLDTTPEAGAPGGVQLGAVIEAAIVDWVEGLSVRRNDGRAFTA